MMQSNMIRGVLESQDRGFIHVQVVEFYFPSMIPMISPIELDISRGHAMYFDLFLHCRPPLPSPKLDLERLALT